MSVTKRDDHQHTYGDYLIWSRTHGDELIDGTAYVREPPSPTYGHQSIALELAHQFKKQLEGTPWRVIIAPMDVRLPKSTEPDDQVNTVVQPDVMITRDKSKIDDRGVRGAPDWLAEVLSPSTASYDWISPLEIRTDRMSKQKRYDTCPDLVLCLCPKSRYWRCNADVATALKRSSGWSRRLISLE